VDQVVTVYFRDVSWFSQPWLTVWRLAFTPRQVLILLPTGLLVVLVLLASASSNLVLGVVLAIAVSTPGLLMAFKATSMVTPERQLFHILTLKQPSREVKGAAPSGTKGEKTKEEKLTVTTDRDGWFRAVLPVFQGRRPVKGKFTIHIDGVFFKERETDEDGNLNLYARLGPGTHLVEAFRQGSTEPVMKTELRVKRR
jgi:hypothetical protein